MTRFTTGISYEKSKRWYQLHALSFSDDTTFASYILARNKKAKPSLAVVSIANFHFFPLGLTSLPARLPFNARRCIMLWSCSPDHFTVLISVGIILPGWPPPASFTSVYPSRCHLILVDADAAQGRWAGEDRGVRGCGKGVENDVAEM